MFPSSIARIQTMRRFTLILLSCLYGFNRIKVFGLVTMQKLLEKYLKETIMKSLEWRIYLM